MTGTYTVGEKDQEAPRGQQEPARYSTALQAGAKPSWAPGRGAGPSALAPRVSPRQGSVLWVHWLGTLGTEGVVWASWPVHPSGWLRSSGVYLPRNSKETGECWLSNKHNPEGRLPCDSVHSSFLVWPTANKSTLNSYWEGKKIEFESKLNPSMLMHLLSTERD